MEATWVVPGGESGGNGVGVGSTAGLGLGVESATALEGLGVAATATTIAFGEGGAFTRTFGSTTTLAALETIGAPPFWLVASSSTCGPGLSGGGTNTT